MTKRRITAILGAVAVASALVIWLRLSVGHEQFLHIVERELIHLFSGGGMYCVFQWIVRAAEQHVLTRRLGGYLFFGLPAFLASFCIALFELANVNDGGLLIKSYLDIAFWAIGMAFPAWTQYRHGERVVEAARDISRNGRKIRAKDALRGVG